MAQVRKQLTTTYMLELNDDEAQAVLDILERVTGTGSRRHDTDSVLVALERAGVEPSRLDDVDGQLTFR